MSATHQHERATLLHRFLDWEASQPDAIYLTEPLEDGTVVEYRWGYVGEQARRMASHLQSLGLPPKSNIAILGKNSAHWIIADLAIWLAGHVSVPIYATANAGTVSYVLEHSGARLMFVGRLDGGEAGWRDLSVSVPPELPLITLPRSSRQGGQSWAQVVGDCQPLANPPLPVRDELATIIYTSGSTGNPKGVMLSFAAMYDVLPATRVMYNGGKGTSTSDRLLSYLPLAHTAERAVVEALSLYSGCQVFFNESLETFAADLRRARPTIFMSVPRLWGKFYHGINERIPPAVQAAALADPQQAGAMRQQILGALGLDQVHTGLSGSAPLPAAVHAWYRDLGLELLEGYGMSENFGTSHFSRPGEVRIGYVGAALPGVECRIAEDGEILVRSMGQMLGYYRQPELTAECYTEDGLFRTGDRGELDDAGRLRITGRVKDLFKTAKGKYVAPVPIEAKLGNHQSVEASCVIGVGLAQPIGLINVSLDTRAALASAEARAQLAVELEALLADVNAQLEAHEQLACLVVAQEPWNIENGLLTPTLKIRRNLIEELYHERAEAWGNSRRKVILE